MPISGGSRGLSIVPYVYSGALANGADFMPPANTIVTQANLEGATIDAVAKFYVAETNFIADAFSMAESNNNRGIARVIVCDGTGVKYHNGEGLSQNLKLRGVTYS